VNGSISVLKGIGSNHTQQRKLRRGDQIKIGSRIYTISMDETRQFDAKIIPLSEPIEDDIISPSRVYYVGDRFVEASEKTVAVAQRAGAYKVKHCK